MPPFRGALHLSERERQCLEIAAKGFSNREIAEVLQLRENTVGEYIERVKRKLEVETRVEMIVLAIKTGLITP